MCKGETSLESVPSSSSSMDTADLKAPSGFEQHRSSVEAGLVFLSVLYGSLYFVNPPVEVNPELCPASEDGVCRRPDLIAYKIVGLLAMITMGIIGVYNWHFSAKMQQLASKQATPEDRLFGYLPASNHLNVVIFCYQLYDICVSLTIPEHLDAIFLTHHLLALTTAYCSLEYQMVSYYSIFFGGCSEFSSIFLVFLDKHQVVIIPPGSVFETWVQICQVLFFITFSFYRIYGWISNSFTLWRDCEAVIQSGSVERHRPGKTYFLRLFQCLDFILGSLQVFWYYKILEKVVDLASS